jgi:hypothetical protein
MWIVYHTTTVSEHNQQDKRVTRLPSLAGGVNLYNCQAMNE